MRIHIFFLNLLRGSTDVSFGYEFINARNLPVILFFYKD